MFEFQLILSRLRTLGRISCWLNLKVHNQLCIVIIQLFWCKLMKLLRSYNEKHIRCVAFWGLCHTSNFGMKTTRRGRDFCSAVNRINNLWQGNGTTTTGVPFTSTFSGCFVRTRFFFTQVENFTKISKRINPKWIFLRYMEGEWQI